MTDIGMFFLYAVGFWVSVCIIGAWMNGWKPIEFKRGNGSWEPDGHP